MAWSFEPARSHTVVESELLMQKSACDRITADKRKASTNMSAEDIYSIQVLNRREVIKAIGVNERTFDRMESVGDAPPKTQISARRIGYRAADVQRWLDARRRG
jgi:predicted DNA-binding transcriptional regulator AlpA